MSTGSALPAPAGSRGIGYFERFGVTERMIREALGAALSHGGDFADLFYQHRVEGNLALEDGAVNRAYRSVELGVGVRVVRGDQTGYGYTEDLSPEAVLAAARTAATIAAGAAREGPGRLQVAPRSADRYPAKVPGDERDAGTRLQLPLLASVNERLLALDECAPTRATIATRPYSAVKASTMRLVSR